MFQNNPARKTFWSSGKHLGIAAANIFLFFCRPSGPEHSELKILK
jgi:hypothetical protein